MEIHESSQEFILGALPEIRGQRPKAGRGSEPSPHQLSVLRKRCKLPSGE